MTAGRVRVGGGAAGTGVKPSREVVTGAGVKAGGGAAPGGGDVAARVIPAAGVAVRRPGGGWAPRASRSATTASTSAREEASSTVNWTPMPGRRGGVAPGSSDSTQRTTPSPRITFSPVESRSSKATAVPTGLGSRVWMKTPPRDRLGAKRSLKSSSVR